MIVLDTSAALDCIVGVEPAPGLRERVAGARSLHVPHLFDVEFLSGLRGLLLGGTLTQDRAHDALGDLNSLRLVRYPILGLVDRVWAKRHTLTAHDAVFVSLAEVLRCPLVTCDQRLAKAPHDAGVELFVGSG